MCELIPSSEIDVISTSDILKKMVKSIYSTLGDERNRLFSTGNELMSN